MHGCTDKKCVQICPSGALSVMGREMSVEDIWEEVKRDIVFYGKGRGGITGERRRGRSSMQNL